MRRRQPDVQRHDARLDAEAEQEQQKRGVAPARGHLFAQRVETVEAVAARGLEQQQEAEDEAARADVRHDEVEHAGVARFVLLVLEADQAIGRQRHDFPGDQKEERVGRREHQRRRQQQRIVEGAEHADALAPVKSARIAERINRKRQPQQRHDQHEERAQRVEPHGELDVGDERRQQLQRGGGPAGPWPAGGRGRPLRPALPTRRTPERKIIGEPLGAQEQQPRPRPGDIPQQGQQQDGGISWSMSVGISPRHGWRLCNSPCSLVAGAGPLPSAGGLRTSSMRSSAWRVPGGRPRVSASPR